MKRNRCWVRSNHPQSWRSVGSDGCNVAVAEDDGELSEDVDVTVSEGARGELLDGLSRAWMMSLALAMMRSTEEARGMVTLDGNQVRVLKMRSRQMSHIQMV
jgi:hypothetical protein